jgi:hypothetical protein
LQCLCNLIWNFRAKKLLGLEKQFRQFSLKKGQDPDIWITELENYRMRLEEMGSKISENQFILHILNNMTDDYDLQLAMMKKRVTDKSNPLTIDKIRDNLNLRFKRLNEKQNEEIENDNNQEVAYLVVNLKENVEIVVQMGIKRKTVNQKQTKEAVRIAEITTIFRKI